MGNLYPFLRVPDVKYECGVEEYLIRGIKESLWRIQRNYEGSE